MGFWFPCLSVGPYRFHGLDVGIAPVTVIGGSAHTKECFWCKDCQLWTWSKHSASKTQKNSRLHLGLLSVHAADVGNLTTNRLFAAQAFACPRPAAIDSWRIFGWNGNLTA